MSENGAKTIESSNVFIQTTERYTSGVILKKKKDCFTVNCCFASCHFDI